MTEFKLLYMRVVLIINKVRFSKERQEVHDSLLLIDAELFSHWSTNIYCTTGGYTIDPSSALMQPVV